MQLHKYVVAQAGLVLLAACTAAPPTAPPQAATAGSPPLNVPRLGYPESMLRNREGADVDSGCNVDVQGIPHDCQVLSLVGNPDAAKQALDYVNHSRYAPRTHNGVPIASYHTWHIRFRLKPLIQT